MRNFLTITLFLATALTLQAANPGDEVIVVYNKRMPGSKDVAAHYAEKRKVPASQIFGFNLTTNEDISREEFRDQLQKPLAKELESKKLWHIGSEIYPGTNGQPGKVVWRVKQSKIRYAVLCYGVPLRIAEDPSLKEEVPEMRPELRRNDAAVDSELAMLPWIEEHLPVTGLQINSSYTTTNAAWLHPTNGILLVTRLDGPNASIARGLVDKAMEAETNGLCGRAYFDWRGVATNSPLIVGDQWIMASSKICQYYGGYETLNDTNPGTFPADFPMNQTAIYCGWYDESASGPFAQNDVEFMPGAFAYHLHSFSAATLRSATRNWCGPLLTEGAAATMGCVDEPFIGGTPDVSVFLARWIVYGFTFGEAAYAAQHTLSWQTTVIGDPLYRPFGKSLQALIQQQDQTHNSSIEWSYLREVNIALLSGKRPAELAASLEVLPATKKSAVLTEKLGDLYEALGKPASATEAYVNALKLNASPLQRVRIRLALADELTELNQAKEAAADLRALLSDDPDYPGKPTVERKIQDLAGKVDQKESAAAPSGGTNP